MKLLQLTGLVLTVSTLYVWSRIPVTSFEPDSGEVISLSVPFPAGIGSQVKDRAWRKAKASWYTSPSNRTADGTRMSLDGRWAATRLVPMGTTIEIRNKAGKVWTIKRRDTPAKRFGDRLDLPKGFWGTVTGAKPSAGLVTIEWRVK